MAPCLEESNPNVLLAIAAHEMMQHNTKFGYKRLSGSEESLYKAGHTDMVIPVYPPPPNFVMGGTQH